METAKPVVTFRAGAVTCALWENEIRVDGSPQKILKASVTRRYQDRSGAWKTSQSFSRNEIPLAIYTLQKAFEAMLQRPEDEPPHEADVDEMVI